jgi:hypothetical protein
MPLSWNEIRDRATAFAHEWQHTKDEDADAKSFLDAFFGVFGVRRRKAASFEKRVKKLDGRGGYVDPLEGHLAHREEEPRQRPGEGLTAGTGQLTGHQ